LLIRWVGADDAQLLHQSFEDLSERSRWQRFFSSSPVLPDRLIRYLTDIDHVDHMAWGAVDLSQPDPPGVGIARYIRNSGESPEAEVAITVVDSFQGRGIGTLLYAALNYSAAANGIRHFTFYVMFENSAFIRRLKSYGGRITGRDHDVAHIRLPVHARADDVPVSNHSGRRLKDAMQSIAGVEYPRRFPESSNPSDN